MGTKEKAEVGANDTDKSRQVDFKVDDFLGH